MFFRFIKWWHLIYSTVISHFILLINKSIPLKQFYLVYSLYIQILISNLYIFMSFFFQSCISTFDKVVQSTLFFLIDLRFQVFFHALQNTSFDCFLIICMDASCSSILLENSYLHYQKLFESFFMLVFLEEPYFKTKYQSFY